MKKEAHHGKIGSHGRVTGRTHWEGGGPTLDFCTIPGSAKKMVYEPQGKHSRIKREPKKTQSIGK